MQAGILCDRAMSHRYEVEGLNGEEKDSLAADLRPINTHIKVVVLSLFPIYNYTS